MGKAIRFGGRRGSARSRDDIDASLSAVLEQLSWKLKEPFRRYLNKHGGKIFDEGLEVEEIWAAQQLHDASPVAAFVADRHKSLLTPRMTPVEMLAELDSALDCFEGAANLGLPGVSGDVAELLRQQGTGNWRRPGADVILRIHAQREQAPRVAEP